jgi:hypothetical protein
MFGKVYELCVMGVGMDSYATILRTQLELLSGQIIFRITLFDHHRINKKANHESTHFNFAKKIMSLREIYTPSFLWKSFIVVSIQ